MELEIRTSLYRAMSKFPQRLSVGQVKQSIAERVLEKKGSSLIRLSHCEAKFLNYPSLITRKEMNRSLKRQFGYTDLTDDDINNISQMLREAIRSSDILGVPVLGDHQLDAADEGDDGNWYFSLILPALSQNGLVCEDTEFCSHNIHLRLGESDLLGLLRRLDVPIGLVGCRDLRDELKRIGFNNVAYVGVPEAARTRAPGVLVERHYPVAFNRILDQLSAPDRFRVYLVGAGFLGKIYASRIAEHGGVAIDMGSVLDLWAGVASRSGYSEALSRWRL